MVLLPLFFNLNGAVTWGLGRGHDEYKWTAISLMLSYSLEVCDSEVNAAGRVKMPPGTGLNELRERERPGAVSCYLSHACAPLSLPV